VVRGVGTLVVATACVVGVVGRVDVDVSVAAVAVAVVGVGVVDVLDDLLAAPAMPAISKNAPAMGTAIFAHRGQEPTQPHGVVPVVVRCCPFGEAQEIGCVGAVSGGYHLPSDASHHPGSSGCLS
jgi:hypothetical protein